MNNLIERIWKQGGMVNIEDLRGTAFQAEEMAHTFRIRGVDASGEPLALTGTVGAVFLRADNTDVTITGTITDGAAEITLTDECYDMPGRFGLTIYVTSDEQTVAVYAAIGSVCRTSSGVVSPETGEDVMDLINAIAAAVATIPASYTDLMGAVAPTYSTSALYAVGSYAWYNGKLYRCTTAITSGETWTSAHWTQAVLGNDVTDLKDALESFEKHLGKDSFSGNNAFGTSWNGILIVDLPFASVSANVSVNMKFSDSGTAKLVLLKELGYRKWKIVDVANKAFVSGANTFKNVFITDPANKYYVGVYMPTIASKLTYGTYSSVAYYISHSEFTSEQVVVDTEVNGASKQTNAELNFTLDVVSVYGQDVLDLKDRADALEAFDNQFDTFSQTIGSAFSGNNGFGSSSTAILLFNLPAFVSNAKITVKAKFKASGTAKFILAKKKTSKSFEVVAVEDKAYVTGENTFSNIFSVVIGGEYYVGVYIPTIASNLTYASGTGVGYAYSVLDYQSSDIVTGLVFSKTSDSWNTTGKMNISLSVFGVSYYPADESSAFLDALNGAKGKIISCLGDSMTQGDSGNGMVTPWTYYIPDLTKCTACENKGINGTTISNVKENCMAERYVNMRADANIAVVWGGVNDFAHNAPLGQFGDNTADTFFGALNVLILGLNTKYGDNLKMLFITPPKVKQNTAYDFTRANSQGKYLSDYVDAIKTMCDYYSIPVLNMYEYSGMSPILDGGTYRPDELHFSEAGYQRVAKIIARKLIELQ